MKTESCKKKGRRAAAEFRELLMSWAIGLDPDDIRVTSSGQTGSDLQFSPKAQEVLPFDAVEVKNQEKLTIWSALKQMKKHGNIPILVFTRNHTGLYVAMDAKQFLSIL